MIRPLLACLCLLACTIASAQTVDPSLYDCLRWRMIGPFRGGRTVGAEGVPSQPGVFYIGVNNGGVWKTTDYGRVWRPIFDDQPTGSIGALAVAPSDPNVIYVGSGEGLQRPDLSVGDGMYKSTDGGHTWTHLGLQNGQQIAAILVDPKDANRVFVAVLGHPYGANEERGVFRSTDGGQSFEKVLYKDEDTGAVALAFDPSNSQTIYADLWQARQGPWENGSWQGPNSGLFKSTDGGTTWKQLKMPTGDQALGRIGFGIAPSEPNRIYATVEAGLASGIYRSDDAGETWKQTNQESRVYGRGSDFAEIKVDPKNPDVVYAANTSTYKSTDGGASFTAWKGAPGGDDYHTIWIDPNNSQIVLLASDQGAVITVNGGDTWSSWYNQPTAQFYHVVTDNQFPYWVYGGQQESGSAGVSSRGNDGQITFREWHPVGVEEYGYVAPDPLNPDLIYGGKVTRYDRRTGQVQSVGPTSARGGPYRFLRTAPLVFSTVDPHVLFFAGNVLFKTTNGGDTWDVISPDLTREKPEVPESIGVYRTPDLANMPRRGVIYTIGPSYRDVKVIWAGTDDGLIHVTKDGGKTWANVTPPGLDAWSKVSIIDAGRFDEGTAYAAINRIRLDDMHAHIFRTHDWGKTWTEIASGLPKDPINTVREDPVRKGLLFCGSERAVYFSIDDGDHWQPLRLNMPATSIRDLVIHDDDLVVGTHGRGFWILDSMTALRQIDGKQETALYKPATATRVRWNMNTDTPLPPDEPAAKNPPDGAILDYYLAAPGSVVTLDILDPKGSVVRHYSSADPIQQWNEKELVVPLYWARPPQPLMSAAGSHRFIWDLHYPGQGGGRRGLPMTAIVHDTASNALGPWVMPGEYTVRLTVDGKIHEEALRVVMDPRVKTSKLDLQKQFDVAFGSYEAMREIRETQADVRSLTQQLTDRQKGANAALSEQLAKSIADLAGLEPSLNSLSGQFASVMGLVEAADVRPTTQATAAYERAVKELESVRAKVQEIKNRR